MSIDPNIIMAVKAAIVAGLVRYIIDRTAPKVEGMLKKVFRSKK